MASQNLFKSLKVGRLTLNQRIAMAPLTRMRATGNQVQDNLHPLYYGQRGSSPGTLLITEATFISAAASGYPNAPGIFKPEHIEGWKKVTAAVHKNKSFLYVQLWALGRVANKALLDSLNLPLVSASDIKENPNDESAPAPRPLTKPEIKEYIVNYVQAAKNAIEAGADGVEIHGANGYLLDQFLHENTNRRTDEYGGSVENRARFALEVVDAVSAAIGADRTAIRLSPWGEFGGMEVGISPIPQFSYLVTELQRRALAGNELSYIHLVDPRWTLSTDGSGLKYTEGSNAFVREIWKGVLVRANGFELDSSKEETNNDDKLVIAVGRHFISTPDLVARWKSGTALNEYDRDTFYTSGATGYTDYPFASEVTASA